MDSTYLLTKWLRLYGDDHKCGDVALVTDTRILLYRLTMVGTVFLNKFTVKVVVHDGCRALLKQLGHVCSHLWLEKLMVTGFRQLLGFLNQQPGCRV